MDQRHFSHLKRALTLIIGSTMFVGGCSASVTVAPAPLHVKASTNVAGDFREEFQAFLAAAKAQYVSRNNRSVLQVAPPTDPYFYLNFDSPPPTFVIGGELLMEFDFKEVEPSGAIALYYFAPSNPSFTRVIVKYPDGNICYSRTRDYAIPTYGECYNPTVEITPPPTPPPDGPLSFEADAAFTPNSDGIQDVNKVSVKASGAWTLAVDYWGVVATGSGSRVDDQAVKWDGAVNVGTDDFVALPNGEHTLRLTTDDEVVTATVLIGGVGPSYEGGGGYMKLLIEALNAGAKVVARPAGKIVAPVVISTVGAKLSVSLAKLLKGGTFDKADKTIIFRKTGTSGFAQAQSEYNAFVKYCDGILGKSGGFTKGSDILKTQTFIDKSSISVRNFSSATKKTGVSEPTIQFEASDLVRPILNRLTGQPGTSLKVRYDK